MPSWIRRSFAKGILTTHFPRVPPTEEELPETGRALTVLPGTSGPLSDAARAACPTEAITAAAVDQGRCIRCARCRPAGLVPAGDARSSVGTRESLRWPEGRPLAEPRLAPGPLAAIGRSLHVFLIDVGSCQGCNLEVLGLTNPYYDLHRLGIFFTNSPRHADVLVVVGVPTPAMTEPLRRTYEAMPGPKAVLAVGACAIDGGIFAGSPETPSTVGRIVPVDLYVSGCPPPPVAILEGLLALGRRSCSEGTQ